MVIWSAACGGRAKQDIRVEPRWPRDQKDRWRRHGLLDLHSSLREWLRRLLCAGLALSFGLVLLVALPAPKAAAAPCDTPVVNEVACENTKTGNPSSEWQISGSGNASIQGFATDISVNRGSTIGFKVKTTSKSYRLDIYRMGYYGGDGARKVATVNPTPHFRASRPVRAKAALD